MFLFLLLLDCVVGFKYVADYQGDFVLNACGVCHVHDIYTEFFDNTDRDNDDNEDDDMDDKDVDIITVNGKSCRHTLQVASGHQRR